MKLKYLGLSALACLLAVSCKKGREQMLIGEWQEVAIVNPQLDQTIQEQLVFADTAGRSTDSARNVQLYGTTNMDSFRMNIKINLDSFRKAQADAVQATRFDFRENGLMYIRSADGLDSSSWYLDEDGALIMDEAKLKGSGSQIRMEIQHLSDTMLRLQFNEKYLSSTAIFKPIKK